jgi:prepilin-type N-terminal cleavage/methylation domain-containing protein
MNKGEQGFTLVEVLVSMAVITTLFAFVVPIYISGKTFSKMRMMENNARMLAQSEIERQLSEPKVRDEKKFVSAYQITTKVEREQNLWKIRVETKWKDKNDKICTVDLEVFRFQNMDLPTSK